MTAAGLDLTSHLTGRTTAMRDALSSLHAELERLAYGTTQDDSMLYRDRAELHDRIRACRDLALGALSADDHARHELHQHADMAGPAYAEGRAGRSRGEPVGLKEIAERLGVAQATADQWRQRGVLPEPVWVVGGRPAWTWPLIEGWARETGRLKP